MTAWQLHDLTIEFVLKQEWKRPFSDCLKIAWWLPDNCLMTAWQLPDNCLTISWQFSVLAFVHSGRVCLETRLKKSFFWLPDGCLMTAWWLPDDCLMSAWRLRRPKQPKNEVTKMRWNAHRTEILQKIWFTIWVIWSQEKLLLRLTNL